MSGVKPLVSNSSSLIWLDKIGRLRLLKTLFREVLVPRRVYFEATTNERSADSILISEAVRDEWLKVSGERMEGVSLLASRSGIHLGERCAWT